MYLIILVWTEFVERGDVDAIASVPSSPARCPYAPAVMRAPPAHRWYERWPKAGQGEQGKGVQGKAVQGKAVQGKAVHGCARLWKDVQGCARLGKWVGQQHAYYNVSHVSITITYVNMCSTSFSGGQKLVGNTIC